MTFFAYETDTCSYDSLCFWYTYACGMAASFVEYWIEATVVGEGQHMARDLQYSAQATRKENTESFASATCSKNKN